MADHIPFHFMQINTRSVTGKKIQLKEWLTDDKDKPVTKEQGRAYAEIGYRETFRNSGKIICIEPV